MKKNPFRVKSLEVSNAELAKKYRILAFFWMTLALVGWLIILTFCISFSLTVWG